MLTLKPERRHHGTPPDHQPRRHRKIHLRRTRDLHHLVIENGRSFHVPGEPRIRTQWDDTPMVRAPSFGTGQHLTLPIPGNHLPRSPGHPHPDTKEQSGGGCPQRSGLPLAPAVHHRQKMHQHRVLARRAMRTLRSAPDSSDQHRNGSRASVFWADCSVKGHEDALQNFKNRGSAASHNNPGTRRRPWMDEFHEEAEIQANDGNE